MNHPVLRQSGSTSSPPLSFDVAHDPSKDPEFIEGEPSRVSSRGSGLALSGVEGPIEDQASSIKSLFHRGGVADFLTQVPRLEDAAHDLSASCLWDSVAEIDLTGGGMRR